MNLRCHSALTLYAFAALACETPRPLADAAVPLERDSGVVAPQDSGVLDAGPCDGCPEGARCDEASGCTYVCQSCERHNDCFGGECAVVGQGPDGYCVRRIAACAPTANIANVDLELSPPRCGPVSTCVFVVRYTRHGDVMAMIVRHPGDGGLLEQPLAVVVDAGLGQAWDRANPWCLRQEQFSRLDDCLSHGIGVALKARSSSGAMVELEFSRGSGFVPPADLEFALTATINALLPHAADAGFW